MTGCIPHDGSAIIIQLGQSSQASAVIERRLHQRIFDLLLHAVGIHQVIMCFESCLSATLAANPERAPAKVIILKYNSSSLIQNSSFLIKNHGF